MVGPVAIDGVLRQGAPAPGVDATDAMNLKVDVQIDKTATTDFMGMTNALQILFAIVPRPDAKRLQAIDAKGLFSV